MKRPSPFNGMRHIALVVEKFEECEAFYTDIMGMEVLRRANENLVYLTCGNDNLSLGRAKAQRVCSPTSVDHFGFIVNSKEELQEWYEFMQARGVTLLDEPHDIAMARGAFIVKIPRGMSFSPSIILSFHPKRSFRALGVSDITLSDCIVA